LGFQTLDLVGLFLKWDFDGGALAVQALVLLVLDVADYLATG
jgi:hypothetical protein